MTDKIAEIAAECERFALTKTRLLRKVVLARLENTDA